MNCPKCNEQMIVRHKISDDTNGVALKYHWCDKCKKALVEFDGDDFISRIKEIKL